MNRSPTRVMRLAALLAGLLAAPSADATTVTLTTAQSQFDPGVDNRGWWSFTDPTVDANSNYAIGELSNDFFTFDLSSLSQPVVGAQLEIVRGTVQSDEAGETIEFFDVATDAAVLNQNVGSSSAIFDDLGSGTSYGSFFVSSTGLPSDVLLFVLNDAALADIEAAAGGFFSVGGTLTSGPPEVTLTNWVFGFTSQATPTSRLVLTVLPEPSCALLVAVAVGSILLRRR